MLKSASVSSIASTEPNSNRLQNFRLKMLFAPSTDAWFHGLRGAVKTGMISSWSRNRTTFPIVLLPWSASGEGEPVVELNHFGLFEPVEERLAMLDHLITGFRVNPLKVLQFSRKSQ